MFNSISVEKFRVVIALLALLVVLTFAGPKARASEQDCVNYCQANLNGCSGASCCNYGRCLTDFTQQWYCDCYALNGNPYCAAYDTWNYCP